MPILAEQAIESTGLEKNREVFITPFDSRAGTQFGVAALRPARTDPSCDTIRGQGVIIAGEEPFMNPPSGQAAVLMQANTTVPSLSFSDLAFVGTSSAGQSFRIFRGAGQKAEGFSNASMDFIDMRFDLSKMRTEAVGANPEWSRSQGGFFLAPNAAGHVRDLSS
jgi:hypothetical protein